MAAILLRALLALTIILGAAPARSQPIFADWSGLYTGWGSESGWGINLAMHGDAYFISWLTYDTDGSQMWLVVPRAAREGLFQLHRYSGPMYRTTGPAFSQTPWNPSAVGVTQVGTGTLSFEGPIADEFIRFTYVLNGVSGYKDLRWQVFGAFPICPGDGAKAVYQDLWWGGAAESGWGLHVNHQGDVVFAIWLTIDAAGGATWVVMPRGERIGASESFSGALYRTTGPAFNSQPWDSSRVIAAEVGRATLDFADIGHGTFTYTMQGVTQSKAISRQGVSDVYANCRVR